MSVDAQTVTESVRIPLHSLQADLEYLIGRVIADGSCGSMIVKSMRDRLDQIEAVMTWRPIETAPRDGTRILAFGGGLTNQAEVVSYNAEVGAWNAPNDTLDDRDDEPDGYCRPTHWMPLPLSPQGSAGS